MALSSPWTARSRAEQEAQIGDAPGGRRSVGVLRRAQHRRSSSRSPWACRRAPTGRRPPGGADRRHDARRGHWRAWWSAGWRKWFRLDP